MLSKMWEEWVLDVSFDMPVFVPYERDTDTIVIGMNVARATSPGKLVGVIHEGGQEAVDEWIANHPEWKEEYGYRENEEEEPMVLPDHYYENLSDRLRWLTSEILRLEINAEYSEDESHRVIASQELVRLRAEKDSIEAVIAQQINKNREQENEEPKTSSFSDNK